MAARRDIGPTVVSLTQAGLTTHEAFRVLGATCSDGPLPPAWKEGWAVHPFVARGRAHYWYRRRADDLPAGVQSMCYRQCDGAKTLAVETRAVHLLGPGNVPHCKRCQRAVEVRHKHGLDRRR